MRVGSFARCGRQSPLARTHARSSRAGQGRFTAPHSTEAIHFEGRQCLAWDYDYY